MKTIPQDFESALRNHRVSGVLTFINRYVLVITTNKQAINRLGCIDCLTPEALLFAAVFTKCR